MRAHRPDTVVPARGPIDWNAREVVASDAVSVSLRADMQLANASGAAAVGYASIDEITNVGTSAWDRDTGRVSIRILSIRRRASMRARRT